MCKGKEPLKITRDDFDKNYIFIQIFRKDVAWEKENTVRWYGYSRSDESIQTALQGCLPFERFSERPCWRLRISADDKWYIDENMYIDKNVYTFNQNAVISDGGHF